MINKLYDMHYGAFKETFRRAELLRKHMTEPEKLLWNRLKTYKTQGYKFRRQHPINRFIVDFYCHKAKLVIEIDGKIHLNKQVKEKDIDREKELLEFGLKVLRFTNDQVISNPDKVLSIISNSLAKNSASL
jgi:very-short-patch-repair endonuclease